MTRAFERRMLNAFAATNHAMGRSEFVIWCFEPDKMPAMIDLLIAQGRLTEADRIALRPLDGSRGPRRALRPGRREGDRRRREGGSRRIRTLTADGWDALVQGMEAFEAFMRDRCGGIDPDERAAFEELERTARLHRPARA